MPMGNDFVSFLILAKRNTYASGIQPSAASRTASHDLPYQEGEFQYLDTYLGGFHFIGEEAVWKGGVALWGMNYYGWMLAHTVPEGFGEFLKEVLLHLPDEAPYRGPAEYRDAGVVIRGKTICTKGLKFSPNISRSMFVSSVLPTPDGPANNAPPRRFSTA